MQTSVDWEYTSVVSRFLRRIKMKRPQYLSIGTVICLFALFLGCAKSPSESAAIDPAQLKAYAPCPKVPPGKNRSPRRRSRSAECCTTNPGCPRARKNPAKIGRASGREREEITVVAA